MNQVVSMLIKKQKNNNLQQVKNQNWMQNQVQNCGIQFTKRQFFGNFFSPNRNTFGNSGERIFSEFPCPDKAWVYPPMWRL